MRRLYDWILPEPLIPRLDETSMELMAAWLQSRPKLFSSAVADWIMEGLARRGLPVPGRKVCPHGDPLCPCPDGDPCHYEPDPDAPTESGRLAMAHDHPDPEWMGRVGCPACADRLAPEITLEQVIDHHEAWDREIRRRRAGP